MNGHKNRDSVYESQSGIPLPSAGPTVSVVPVSLSVGNPVGTGRLVYMNGTRQVFRAF